MNVGRFIVDFCSGTTDEIRAWLEDQVGYPKEVPIPPECVYASITWLDDAVGTYIIELMDHNYKLLDRTVL